MHSGRPAAAGSPAGSVPLGMVQGHAGNISFDDSTLSKHVLFLGGIGTGKTNAMKQLVQTLRREAGPDDVFIIFDTKGDFFEDFYRTGDAVLASSPRNVPGGVIWNLFRDLFGEDQAGRSDQIYEIASTVFSQEISQASDNYFFAAAARDIFAAVVEVMSEGEAQCSNRDLRETLERPVEELLEVLQQHPHLAGSARYLEGDRTPESVLAFLQQTLNKSFSGVFREAGDFSVRQFVCTKRARALFIEYDIATGSRLSPIYRILMDMAITEALDSGGGEPGATSSSSWTSSPCCPSCPISAKESTSAAASGSSSWSERRTSTRSCMRTRPGSARASCRVSAPCLRSA